MKNMYAIAVSMRTAGDARALPSAFNAATWTAHAAAHAHATAPAAAPRKRRTATAAFVDRGIS